jgi:cell wall-associated NlpC family hydrolase
VTTLALPSSAGAAPASTPAPSQSQIDATQSQVDSILATIAHEQQVSDSLSQKYDTAQQQVQQVHAALVATQSQLTVIRAHLAADRKRLGNDAINAYVYGVNDAASPDLFTTPATKADATKVYNETVVGDLAGAAKAVQRAQSSLETQQARQQDEERQANAAAAQVRTLEAANESAQQAAEATLHQVQGQLAQEVAAAAEEKAKEEAAAAAAARNKAAQEAAIAAAAAATNVAQTVGGTQAGATATNGANQAAGGTGGSASGGGSAGGSPSGGSGSGSPPTNVGSSGAATGAGNAAVTAAETQLGVPYQWGGESPGSGFDCSGLTQWAWARAGVSIPRTSQTQWAGLPHVSLSALQPGDLLFYFNLDGDNSVDHVVMYVGSGPYGSQTIIQAPHTGSTVSYAPVFTLGLIGAARP